MTEGTLPVYLRLATRRLTMDAPDVRLGVLAHAALSGAGARVVESVEAGVPAGARDVALSWPRQHDLLLRDLAGSSPPIDAPDGRGVVVSDLASTVAQAEPGPFSAPVLWAAPASCLLDPRSVPPAALTLTENDARLLRDAGIHAASLVAWPRTRDGLVEPRRVVIATASDGEAHLEAVVDALASTLPGRPVIDVVPDRPLELAGVRHVPRHPWLRTRLARSADLVLVLGRSASADLVAAEAVLGGATCVRVTPGPDPTPPLSSLITLVEALPAGLGLAGMDTAADADTLHLPLAALAGWLVEVSGRRPDQLGEERR